MNRFLYRYLEICELKAEWHFEFEKMLKNHLVEMFPDMIIYFEPYDDCWVIDSPSHSELGPTCVASFSEVWDDAVEQFPLPSGKQHLLLLMPKCRSLDGFYLNGEEAQKVKDTLNRVFNLPTC
jgi:hypothetical protein